MKGYKILNKDMTSHGGFTWELGKKYTIDKPGIEMCSDQVFHYYNDPRLAVVFNPIHSDYEDRRLFECKVGKEVNNDQLKFAAKEMTIIKEIKVPEISLDQKVEFGIRCALVVYKGEGFVKWAEDWLSGKDRSASAASAARAAARAAEWAAASAAEWAEWAEWAAARTAEWAAARAAARTDEWAAASAARAAARAAEWAAARTARAAARAAEIDFIAIMDNI